MPVRIYEIAKKLGIDNKQVLAKAQDLGVPNAKTPSSSLDKITAEFVENELVKELSGGSSPSSSTHMGETHAGIESGPVLIRATPLGGSDDSDESEDDHMDQESASTEDSGITSRPSRLSPVDEPDPQVEPEDEAEVDFKADRDQSPSTEESGEPQEGISENPSTPTAPQRPGIGDKIGFINLTPGSSRPRPEKRKKEKKKPGAPNEGQKEARPGTPPGQHNPQPGQRPPVQGQRPPGQGQGSGPGTGQGQRPQNQPNTQGGPQGQRPPYQGQGGPQGQYSRPGQGGQGNQGGQQGGGYSQNRPPFNQQGSGDRGRFNRQGGGQQGDFQRNRNDRDRGAVDNREKPGDNRNKGPKKPRFTVADDAPLITMKPPIMVRALAEKLDLKPFQLISDLMQLGVFANVSQSIDEETAVQVCAKHKFRFESERRDKTKGYVPTKAKVVLDADDREDDLQPRAPVITIMGHVDHGKTTLLDFIRKSNVVSGEDGGITQHIGAYSIEIPHPEHPDEMKKITFLDTPGHAAFSAMRARGADVTDIVILVCAADDGIMPQTREALNHAKAAEVPIIIAVNKCDSANANPMRVRQEFQGLGMAPEEWGGETIFVDVSALKGDGVDTLLSMILLQAEIMELKANPNRLAVGNVVESSVDQGGPAATVLVRKGTLRVGDVVVCGTQWGKVRALISHDGTRIKSAGPSMAVKVLGLSGAPDAGTEFNVMVKEREAKELVEERLLQNKESNELARRKNTLESFFQQISSKDDKILNLIVKTDTQGSNEAIVESLTKIESNKAAVKVIHSAVGSITESDILLASTSDAIILGFHTKMDSGAAPLAKREGVQIKQYTIIYELLDEVKDAMTGLLEPELKEVTTGTAEVRQVFTMSKGGTVAGCYVRDGKLTKGKVRVLRNSEMIHQGVINTLRRFQDEVNEVRNGMECGLRISDFNDYKEGDILESFMIEKVASKL